MNLKNNGKYEEDVKKYYGDLNEILNDLLKLRLPDDRKDENKNEYWSFRGQRDCKWKLKSAPHSRVVITDKDGLKNEDKYDRWFSQYKKRMLHSRDHDYLNDKNPWWWLFYAKHHDLHTRLLDWSSNPLVAIYFAVENILSRKNDKTGGAIWALKVNKEHFRTADELINKYKLEPSSGRIMNEKEWFMINPEPVTHRIVLQSGKFTYHPGKVPKPIEELSRREDERLIKIKIDPSHNDDIRRKLGIMNIHHGSLFPSPTGTAFFVNLEWPTIASY